MTGEIVRNEQSLSIAQNASPYVKTVLICHNTLIRTGISYILAGTDFVISYEVSEPISELPILCLIHFDPSAGELLPTVEGVMAQWPSARMVLLTDRIDATAMEAALQAGLDGLCATAMDREPLIKALELVMLGETFVSSTLTLSLLDEASRDRDARPDGAVLVRPTTSVKLSDREIQILHQVTEGASNKQIARELGLAEATVKVHLKAVLQKLKASNRTQAAMWARQHMNLTAKNTLIAAE